MRSAGPAQATGRPSIAAASRRRAVEPPELAPWDRPSPFDHLLQPSGKAVTSVTAAAGCPGSFRYSLTAPVTVSVTSME